MKANRITMDRLKGKIALNMTVNECLAMASYLSKELFRKYVEDKERYKKSN